MLKFHALSNATGLPSVTPVDLRGELRGPAPPVILDVREPHDAQASQIPGARHIPLEDLAHRYPELGADTRIVVLCRSGVRSAEATGFLLRQGFRNVRNVSGGLDAWAREPGPDLDAP
jgi:adenylyltransferase/sulfurtransferase